ncbi:MAG: hypothetical protein QXG32_01020 [Candidatus Bathyarchaeia archaeon]
MAAAAARALQLLFYQDYFASTYGFGAMLDRLSEGYHRWVLMVSTIDRGFVYSDFKPMPNLAVVWPPLYQYASSILMALSGSRSLWIPRALSLLSGVLTCLIVSAMCYRIYGSSWKALIGGLVLAAQPWHMDYSVLTSIEVPLGLLLCLAIWALMEDRVASFSALLILMMMTSYTGWALSAILMALAYAQRGWRWRGASIPLASMALAFAAWCGWGYANAGSAFAWLSTYLALIGWRPAFDPALLLFYPNLSLVMTFFVFFIGALFGSIKGGWARFAVAASILFLLAISIAHSIALDPGGIERIVPLTPLMALSVPSAFPEFRGRAARRGALALALVLLLLVPLSTQGLIGPKKAYIIMPEYRTALELRKRYSGGAVLCDSPTIIYYSGIDPKAFLSFDHLASSGAMRDPKSIADWLRANGVGYLIWQNASFSKSWILFPDLGVAGDRWIESVRLVPAYEDSIRSYRGSGPGKGNYTQWEHVYPGVHDLVMYKVEFS